jgi:hypothetical protein
MVIAAYAGIQDIQVFPASRSREVDNAGLFWDTLQVRRI